MFSRALGTVSYRVVRNSKSASGFGLRDIAWRSLFRPSVLQGIESARDWVFSSPFPWLV
jgi:hypothetical protein